MCLISTSQSLGRTCSILTNTLSHWRSGPHPLKYRREVWREIGHGASVVPGVSPLLDGGEGPGHWGWTGHRSLNRRYPDLDICCWHLPTLLEEPGANLFFSFFTPLYLIHQRFLSTFTLRCIKAIEVPPSPPPSILVQTPLPRSKPQWPSDLRPCSVHPYLHSATRTCFIEKLFLCLLGHCQRLQHFSSLLGQTPNNSTFQSPRDVAPPSSRCHCGPPPVSHWLSRPALAGPKGLSSCLVQAVMLISPGLCASFLLQYQRFYAILFFCQREGANHTM